MSFFKILNYIPKSFSKIPDKLTINSFGSKFCNFIAPRKHDWTRPFYNLNKNRSQFKQTVPTVIRSQKTMPQKGKFVFRRAKIEDLKCVHNMIKELAATESMEEGPKLTVDELICDSGLTGGKEFCHIYVMEDQCEKNVLAGYSICCFTYSTWEGKMYFLEDLYLRPHYRNKGIGEQMFREIAAKAKEFGCRRVEFHVLECNPARRFYARMGAVDLTETEKWHYYRVKGPQIDKLVKELKKST